jgi:phenylpropionate dioxygenase-like ring-hydroxylating dioxygenase large terminal subunit
MHSSPRSVDWIGELASRQTPGYALEQPFYTDPAIFEHELQCAILPYWLFVGHEARIPRQGDFFQANIAGEMVIVSRHQDGQIYAFLNVCRHRGSRVCLAEEGHTRRFVCPYHAWSYECDGRLAAASKMPTGFDKAQFGLKPFQVRVVEGLVFVNLSDAPVPFDAVQRDAAVYLQPHGFTRAKIAKRQVWTVKANWKLVMENFRECYHCAPAHPEYTSVMGHGLDDALDRSKLEPPLRRFTDDWYAADEKRGRPPVQQGRQGEHWHLCGRYPIREGFVTQSQDGQPLAPLMGDISAHDGGVTTLSVYPLHYTTASSDVATLFRFTPIASQLTDVELTTLVHEDAVEGRDYDLEKLTWLWRVTTDQDKTIVENNQAGVNSRFYQPGPYSEMEPDVKRFIEWYRARIAL